MYQTCPRLQVALGRGHPVGACASGVSVGKRLMITRAARRPTQASGPCFFLVRTLTIGVMTNTTVDLTSLIRSGEFAKPQEQLVRWRPPQPIQGVLI